jgi:hypothetical protein
MRSRNPSPSTRAFEDSPDRCDDAANMLRRHQRGDAPVRAHRRTSTTLGARLVERGEFGSAKRPGFIARIIGAQ